MLQKTNPSRRTIGDIIPRLSLVNHIARSSISVAAKIIKSELGLANIQKSQAFSSFLVGFLLFCIAADRMGIGWGGT